MNINNIQPKQPQNIVNQFIIMQYHKATENNGVNFQIANFE